MTGGFIAIENTYRVGVFPRPLKRLGNGLPFGGIVGVGTGPPQASAFPTDVPTLEPSPPARQGRQGGQSGAAGLQESQCPSALVGFPGAAADGELPGWFPSLGLEGEKGPRVAGRGRS